MDDMYISFNRFLRMQYIFDPEGEEQALLPCPFCGSREIKYYAYEENEGGESSPLYGVVCCSCMASIDTGLDHDIKPVQKKWNTREGRTDGRNQSHGAGQEKY